MNNIISKLFLKTEEQLQRLVLEIEDPIKLSIVVNVTISIEEDINEEQRTELLNQADACYVIRMIEGDWNIEKATVLNEPVLV